MSSTEKLLDKMYFDKFGEYVVWPYGANLDEKKRVDLLKKALIDDKPIELVDKEYLVTE